MCAHIDRGWQDRGDPRRVVHRKNDAGHDLNVQTDAAKATEFPKDVQVTRGWIVVKVAMTGRKSGLFQKSPRVSNGSPPSRFAGKNTGSAALRFESQKASRHGTGGSSHWCRVGQQSRRGRREERPCIDKRWLPRADRFEWRGVCNATQTSQGFRRPLQRSIADVQSPRRYNEVGNGGSMEPAG